MTTAVSPKGNNSYKFVKNVTGNMFISLNTENGSNSLADPGREGVEGGASYQHPPAPMAGDLWFLIHQTLFSPFVSLAIYFYQL